LYRRALVDRDYRRTEREVAEALAKAEEAREALQRLAMDLSGFNLAAYQQLQGTYSMSDLRQWVARMVPRLGGAFLPEGDTWKIETPHCLLNAPRVQPSYRQVTFDRKLAMRRRDAIPQGARSIRPRRSSGIILIPGVVGSISQL